MKILEALRLKTKVSLTVIIILLILLFAGILAINIFKWQGYKLQILPAIEKNLNIKLVASNIAVTWFGLSLKGVEAINLKSPQKDFYNIEKLDIYFSKFSLLFFHPAISKIIIYNTEVELFQGLNYFQTPYITEFNNILIKKANINGGINIKNMVYKPSSFFNKNFEVTGSILGGNNRIYDFSIFRQVEDDAKKNVLTASLLSSDNNIKIDFNSKGNTGEINGKGQNLLLLLSDFTNVGEDLNNLNLNIIEAGASATANNSKNNNSIGTDFTIKGQLLEKNNGLSGTLDIKSDLIELTANYDSNSENKFTINAECPRLNLNLINSMQPLLNFEHTNYFASIIPSYLNGSFNLTIKDIFFKQKDSLKEFNLKANLKAIVSDGKLTLQNFDGSLPGNSAFSLQGIIEKNSAMAASKRENISNSNNNSNNSNGAKQERLEPSLPYNLYSSSKFQGSVNIVSRDPKTFLECFNITYVPISGEKLKFNCQIIAAPQMLLINNFVLSLGQHNEESILRGSLDYKMVYNKQKLRGNFQAEHIDLDKLDWNKIANFITENSTNRGPETKIDFLGSLSNIILNKNYINNIDFQLYSSNKAYLLLLDAKAQNTDITSRLLFKALEKQLKAEISGESFDLNFINWPEILQVNIDKDKKVLVNWNNTKLEPLKNSNLNIEFNTKIKNLSYIPNTAMVKSNNNIDNNNKDNSDNNANNIDNKANNDKFNFSDFEFTGKLNKDILIIDKLTARSGKTTLDLVSNINLGEVNNSMKASFFLQNLEFSEILKRYLKLNYMSGYLNLAGDVSSSGQSVSEFIRNLSGTLEFGASAVKITGVYFNLISSELQNMVTRTEIENLTRIKFFTNETVFKTINGASNIKNGVLATSMKFLSPTTSGVVSSNLDLAQMTNNTILRILFVSTKWNSQVVSVDMFTQGNLWYPRVFFDNDKIYNLIVAKNQAPAAASSTTGLKPT